MNAPKLGASTPSARISLSDLQARYGQCLLREARRFTGNDHDAEDLLQDLWVHLWPRLDTIHSADAAGAFLSRTLLRLALNRRRQASRRIRAASLEDLNAGDGPAIEERLASSEQTPEQQLLQRAEEAERVTIALGALLHLARKKPAQAMAVVHHDLEGREYAELPGNVSTWRTRRERGVVWLRHHCRSSNPI